MRTDLRSVFDGGADTTPVAGRTGLTAVPLCLVGFGRGWSNIAARLRLRICRRHRYGRFGCGCRAGTRTPRDCCIIGQRTGLKVGHRNPGPAGVTDRERPLHLLGETADVDLCGTVDPFLRVSLPDDGENLRRSRPGDLSGAPGTIEALAPPGRAFDLEKRPGPARGHAETLADVALEGTEAEDGVCPPRTKLEEKLPHAGIETVERGDDLAKPPIELRGVEASAHPREVEETTRLGQLGVVTGKDSGPSIERRGAG